MDLTLGKFNGFSNTLNKTISDELTFNNIQFNTEYSEEFPTFKIKTDQDLSGYNYVKFNGFCYFTRGPVQPVDDIWVIPCVMDYLESFYNEITQYMCYVTRSDVEEKYIENSVDVTSCQQEYETIVCNEGFDETEAGGCYVLVTSQRGYSVV